MFLSIQSASGVPIYRQLVDQIRLRILSGQIGDGEKLPSARELSAQLKVNMLTVNKVYQHLESEALVETRRGLGTFARAPQGGLDAVKKRDVMRAAIQDLIREARQLGVDDERLLDWIQEALRADCVAEAATDE